MLLMAVIVLGALSFHPKEAIAACTPNGDSCMFDSSCCSGYCSWYSCFHTCVSRVCQGGDSWCVNSDGELDHKDETCDTSTSYCSNNYCSGGNVVYDDIDINAGCSNGNCYSNESSDTVVLEYCDCGCSGGSCNECYDDCEDLSCYGNDVWCYDSNGQKHHKDEECGSDSNGSDYWTCQNGNAVHIQNILEKGCSSDECYEEWTSENLATTVCGCGCTGGSCNDCYDDCVETNCYGGDVWCYDSNGQKHHKETECGSTSNGTNYWTCVGGNAVHIQNILEKGCQSDACYEEWTTENLATQTCGCGCTGGSCNDCYDDCVETNCYGGDVWCYDSNGQKHHKETECGSTSNGTNYWTCIDGNAVHIQNILEKGCQSDACYEEWTVENLATQTCGCGCTGGSCDQCYDDCVETNCYGGDVWCYDSNGQKHHIAEECDNSTSYCSMDYCHNGNVVYDDISIGAGCSNDSCYSNESSTIVVSEYCSCGCNNAICDECVDDCSSVECYNNDEWCYDSNGVKDHKKTECGNTSNGSDYWTCQDGDAVHIQNIHEMGCEDNSCHDEWVTQVLDEQQCPCGCDEGACLIDCPVDCGYQPCSSNDKECFGLGYHECECDSDGCCDWGDLQLCPEGYVCAFGECHYNPTPCDIIKVEWEIDQTFDGEIVDFMIITAGDCEGQYVQAEIWEDDGILPDDFESSIGNVLLQDGVTTLNWQVFYYANDYSDILDCVGPSDDECWGFSEFYVKVYYKGEDYKSEDLFVGPAEVDVGSLVAALSENPPTWNQCLNMGMTTMTHDCLIQRELANIPPTETKQVSISDQIMFKVTEGCSMCFHSIFDSAYFGFAFSENSGFQSNMYGLTGDQACDLCNEGIAEGVLTFGAFGPPAMGAYAAQAPKFLMTAKVGDKVVAQEALGATLEYQWVGQSGAKAEFVYNGVIIEDAWAFVQGNPLLVQEVRYTDSILTYLGGDLYGEFNLAYEGIFADVSQLTSANKDFVGKLFAHEPRITHVFDYSLPLESGQWNQRPLIRAVELPEGSSILGRYDPFLKEIELNVNVQAQQLIDLTTASKQKTVLSTLLHEITHHSHDELVISKGFPLVADQALQHHPIVELFVEYDLLTDLSMQSSVQQVVHKKLVATQSYDWFQSKTTSQWVELFDSSSIERYSLHELYKRAQLTESLALQNQIKDLMVQSGKWNQFSDELALIDEAFQVHRAEVSIAGSSTPQFKQVVETYKLNHIGVQGYVTTLAFEHDFVNKRICYDGDVWWSDSSGGPTFPNQICLDGQLCVGGECVDQEPEGPVENPTELVVEGLFFSSTPLRENRKTTLDFRLKGKPDCSEPHPLVETESDLITWVFSSCEASFTGSVRYNYTPTFLCGSFGDHELTIQAGPDNEVLHTEEFYVQENCPDSSGSNGCASSSRTPNTSGGMILVMFLLLSTLLLRKKKA
jgi:hypothetical protein